MTPLRCIALVAVALLPAATVAVARPVAPPQLTAEPATVQPGDTFRFTGTGFPRNAQIALFAGPRNTEAQRIGSAQTGRRGRFVATIRVRARSSARAFVAIACVDACRIKASVRFRIVAP